VKRGAVIGEGNVGLVSIQRYITVSIRGGIDFSRRSGLPEGVVGEGGKGVEGKVGVEGGEGRGKEVGRGEGGGGE